jgi:hypothetical protein
MTSRSRRTTVTLDDDVAVNLRSEMHRSHKPFKQALNEALRRGLVARDVAARHPSFRVKARDLGRMRSGVSLDDIGGLLDRLEGDRRR